MKRFYIFLIIAFIISTVTIISYAYNNLGTYEIGGPPFNSINRYAYDSDGPVWSDANTSAHDGLGGHTVSSGSNVYSVRDWHLYGLYDVNARLNHDWVNKKNQRDHDADSWQVYLNKDAYTMDTDWWDSYNPVDTIEYCIADCVATANDIRTPSVIYGTNCYIPW